MPSDQDREYRYIDPQRIEESEAVPVDDTPANILYESLLDVLQLAAAEGMTEDTIDDVLQRILNYRAGQVRKRFTLHTRKPE